MTYPQPLTHILAWYPETTDVEMNEVQFIGKNGKFPLKNPLKIDFKGWEIKKIFWNLP